jgi:hypothetical protein
VCGGMLAATGCSSDTSPSAKDCVRSQGAEVCVSGGQLTGSGLQPGSNLQWLIDYAPERGEHGQAGGSVVADAAGKASSPVEYPSTGAGTNTIEVMARTSDGGALEGDIIEVVGAA